MQLFYAPQLNNEQHILSEEETKHCVRVLRYKVGDRIHITDGKGILSVAEFVNLDTKRAQLKIIESGKQKRERDYNLHIAIAPTKNIDRFEWFLEKATEIGIDEITPIITDHSERKHLKPERLERVLVAALKQSLKVYKPKLNPLKTFTEFIQNNTNEGVKVITHCYNVEKTLFQKLIKKEESVLVLVGPEGDFSKEEVEFALKNGFIAASLGDSRLRTETAGIVVCSLTGFVNQ